MARVSKRSVMFWRIRLCIITAVCEIAVSFAVAPLSIIWNVTTAAFATTFLFMYFLYYPAKYGRLTYSVDSDRIYVKSGVIYCYERYMETNRVQYLNLVADPLQRIMGLNGVLFLSAGSRIYLPCLEKSEAENLVKKVGKV